jgi:hypothetical protein
MFRTRGTEDKKLATFVNFAGGYSSAVICLNCWAQFQERGVAGIPRAFARARGFAQALNNRYRGRG